LPGISRHYSQDGDECGSVGVGPVDRREELAVGSLAESDNHPSANVVVSLHDYVNDRRQPNAAAIRSYVAQLGHRSPASSSRYAGSDTPKRRAACPTDQPACLRSYSSIAGSAAATRA
jgi:hypothetical protein